MRCKMYSDAISPDDLNARVLCMELSTVSDASCSLMYYVDAILWPMGINRPKFYFGQ